MKTIRSAFKLLLSVAFCIVTNIVHLHAQKKFSPDWESLKQYQCPEWFRDAKFGIWAHWTAQSQPEQGDWYAHYMYNPSHRDYKYHLANYGHPSQVGFKDIDHLWKAERWNPERLVDLYKRAGAKYIVALANHHDNFDLWNSTYQPWNSVNIGPQKDIIDIWAKAVRKAGLRFGVSVHASHAWNWFETAQGKDSTGPYAGILYDAVLTKADGKGKWWEGYDPQDLYAQNHPVGAPPSQTYIDKFYNRTIDLIDKYRPDLVNFDDGPMPLDKYSDAGLRIASHYYNANQQWNNGKLEAVLNTKGTKGDQQLCVVGSIERSITDKLLPNVWQTESCIGYWHYQRDLFEQHKYKTVDQAVHMLVDIVSKNGNLLLSIPIRGDGTIDEDGEKFLEGMAAWMSVNGECIFGTRPWQVFGEGPSTTETKEMSRWGGPKEISNKPFTSEDIRFTAKGKTIYAIIMAWPADGKLEIRSLAENGKLPDRKIKTIHLLGILQPLKWKQTANGLEVELPSEKPCNYAYALKIQ